MILETTLMSIVVMINGTIKKYKVKKTPDLCGKPYGPLSRTKAQNQIGITNQQ